MVNLRLPTIRRENSSSGWCGFQQRLLFNLYTSCRSPGSDISLGASFVDSMTGSIGVRCSSLWEKRETRSSLIKLFELVSIL